MNQATTAGLNGGIWAVKKQRQNLNAQLEWQKHIENSEIPEFCMLSVWGQATN